jgi:HAD superfamily hydrolase (TIGR01509 family)
MPDAVIFDLDGVLLDSEQRWNEAKEALVREAGGTWRDEAPEVMMGMSSPEWSAYLRDDLAVPLELGRHQPRRRQAHGGRLPLEAAADPVTPDAIVFDLDGVLLDSEQLWDEAKHALVIEAGGTWREEAPEVMMGMSSPEWSRYLHDELGLEESPEELNAEVVRRMLERYRERLPLLDGAVEAIRRLASSFPLAVASSSNRPLIETVLETAGVADLFAAVVSSEEVGRGKPAPDVYLEAAARLGVEAARCAAIEDSSNGLRSAHAAGMRVLAIPNTHYPPAADALALADVVLRSLAELTVEAVGAER